MPIPVRDDGAGGMALAASARAGPRSRRPRRRRRRCGRSRTPWRTRRSRGGSTAGHARQWRHRRTGPGTPGGAARGSPPHAAASADPQHARGGLFAARAGVPCPCPPAPRRSAGRSLFQTVTGRLRNRWSAGAARPAEPPRRAPSQQLRSPAGACRAPRCGRSRARRWGSTSGFPAPPVVLRAALTHRRNAEINDVQRNIRQ